MKSPWRTALAASAVLLALAVVNAVAFDQGQAPYAGVLDEHPKIQYAGPATTDRVARLNQRLVEGAVSLRRDPRSGYLGSTLEALGLRVESQLLVFSKSGIQRTYTSPQNPRALYFDESVVVGYIAGAPVLEIAAHDPQQGVIFYTLDQDGPSPTFARRTVCLSCHVSATTLDVPGLIDRSNLVGVDGGLLPQLGSYDVTHATPHTQRWGGWFVTGDFGATPYQALGHLGNITVASHPTSGPAIFSDRISIEWADSTPASRGYPSTASDLAALLVFNHQTHAINLMTRLNWDARIASGVAQEGPVPAAVRDRVNELADYLLFVGEAPVVTSVKPPKGFADALVARTPKDRRGRSLGELDLETRLLRYPCSYMVYTDAFTALPRPIRDAVFERMFAVLSGADPSPRYAHLSAADRRAIIEILRETHPDL